MKLYKILRPEKPIWSFQTIELCVSEKKVIRLPLVLISKCHPIIRRFSKNVRIKYEQSGDKKNI